MARNRVRLIERLESFVIPLIQQEGADKKVRGFWPKFLLAVLKGISKIYGAIVRLRMWFFRIGVLRRWPLGCQVISVGNVTAGGTGKTPVAEIFARELTRQGRKVAILSRGYRRKEKPFLQRLFSDTIDPPLVVSDGRRVLLDSETGGDEPYMLASNLPGVVVLVDRNRVKSGRYAIKKFKCDTLVLDDGFQYQRLKHSRDIVLVDKTNPFGNGNLLPRGVLREGIQNLRRADFIFITTPTPSAPRSASSITTPKSSSAVTPPSASRMSTARPTVTSPGSPAKRFSPSPASPSPRASKASSAATVPSSSNASATPTTTATPPRKSSTSSTVPPTSAAMPSSPPRRTPSAFPASPTSPFPSTISASRSRFSKAPRTSTTPSPTSASSPSRGTPMQTCKGALTRPGERKTENGERNARQARDGRSSVTMPSLQVANLPIVRPARHLRCLMARRRRAGGAGRTSPCRGVGQRPTPSNQRISQSANQPIFFVSLVVPCGLCGKTHWQSAGGSRPLIGSNLRNLRFPHSGSLCVPSWFFVSFVFFSKHSTSVHHSARRPTGAFRSLFSVLRSPERTSRRCAP